MVAAWESALSGHGRIMLCVSVAPLRQTTVLKATIEAFFQVHPLNAWIACGLPLTDCTEKRFHGFFLLVDGSAITDCTDAAQGARDLTDDDPYRHPPVLGSVESVAACGASVKSVMGEDHLKY